jgi:tetratricopeptide (TPR) repeat protein
VAFDRNELEQQALKFVAREQLDKAAECYVQILKKDARDVRARQKLAELYSKMGKKTEAFKLFSEVARLHAAAGNHRAALALYKQLVPLKPSDPELQQALGEAYYNSGFRSESIPAFEAAFEGYLGADPNKAVEIGQQLLKLKHDDVALRLKLAEVVKGSKPDSAYAWYREAIDEYRRRGQMGEVARVARTALALRPGDADLLVDAAEASLAADERPEALELLRAAMANDGGNLRVLELFAKAQEQGGDPGAAREALLRLATAHQAAGQAKAELAALERALGFGDADGEIEARRRRVRATIDEAEFRLYRLRAAEPTDDTELRLAARSDVFCRYGMPQRAADELSRALALSPRSVVILAWAAEVAASLGDNETALLHAGTVFELVRPDERPRVAARIKSLGGTPPAISSPAAAEVGPDDLIDDELVDDELIDDELIDDEDTAPPATPPPVRPAAPAPIDDDELIDDEETAPPMARTAQAAPPEPEPEPEPAGLSFGSSFEDSGDAADPFGGDLGGGGGLFADVFQAAAQPPPRPAAPPAPAPARAPTKPSAKGGRAAVEEARGLIGLGMHEDALALLNGVLGLEAAVARAQALREGGDAEAALRQLRLALMESNDDALGLAEALFELSDLAARAGQRRVALRALEEISEFHPDHRAGEVAARVKALRRVLGR